MWLIMSLFVSFFYPITYVYVIFNHAILVIFGLLLL